MRSQPPRASGAPAPVSTSPPQKAGRVRRSESGREGKRKLPDRYSLAGQEHKTSTRLQQPPRGSGERLRPGQLDRLVIEYLREHSKEGPLSPSGGKGPRSLLGGGRE